MAANKDAVKSVVIWGAGDIGEQTLYILSYYPKIRVRAFVDDDKAKVGTEMHGVPIYKPDAETFQRLQREGVVHAIAGAGNGRTRGKLCRRLEELGFEIINAIHPAAHVSPLVELGKGVIVCPGANLSQNPSLGSYIYVGSSAMVGHLNRIENDATINCASVVVSRIHIHEGAFIGASATVVSRNFGHLTVGADAIVGAGALVLDDVPPKAVVVGSPAKIIRYQDA